MTIPKNTYLYTCLLLVSVLAISSFIKVVTSMSFAQSTSVTETQLVEYMLIDVKEDIELFNMISLGSNQKAKEMLSQSLLRKVMSIVFFNIKVEDVKGESLEGLCLLRNFDYDSLFTSYQSEEVIKLIRKFIVDSGDKAIKQIKESQKSLKGSGCYLSPS